jgi:hypothetical protein
LSPALAELPAPDNVFYGLIVLGSNQVTAANTRVTVEAQRADGVPVARYRMGSRPDAGNYYVLTVKVEEMEPRRNPASILANEALILVLKSNDLVQAQHAFPIAGRGRVEQLDFGSVPTNALVGFEAWAQARGLGPGPGNLDADHDGVTNLKEYLAGTDPQDPNSRFALVITQAVSGVQISFSALAASGTGYEGQDRYYTLESATNPKAIAWPSLVGYSNILGSGQRVPYTLPATNPSPAFYRGRVELRSP